MRKKGFKYYRPLSTSRFLNAKGTHITFKSHSNPNPRSPLHRSSTLSRSLTTTISSPSTITSAGLARLLKLLAIANPYAPADRITTRSPVSRRGRSRSLAKESEDSQTGPTMSWRWRGRVFAKESWTGSMAW